MKARAGPGLRRSGLDVLGDVPWGTHFCQFYDTAGDLAEVLVPYLKAGLESNEYCMWVVSGTIPRPEAEAALRRAAPEAGRFLEEGRLELIPHDEWYLKDGRFDPGRVLEGWAGRLKRALARGFEGLRLTGDTFWLERKDWSGFAAYEAEVDASMGASRVLALCTYPLARCGGAELLEVLKNHEFALARRSGAWELVERAEPRSHKSRLRERERREAGERLRRSEARLARSQEMAHLGSWELEVAEDRLTWSDEVYRIFGLEPRAFGASYGAFLDAVHPEDRAVVDAAYSGSLRDGADSYEMEHRVVRRDTGEVRFVHEKCAHVRDAGGRVVRSLGMVHDVTERKKAEAEVLAAKEQWERTFDSVSDLVAVIDREHRIVRVNKAMAERAGVSPRDCVGRRCYELVHGRACPLPSCPHSLTLEDGGLHTCEVSEPRLGGEFLVSTTPLPDASGRMVGSVHVAHDITERKRMEDELRRSRDELEERVRERTAELRETLDRLRLITETISEVFWMADAGLERMLYVSPNYRRVWGVENPGVELDPRAILRCVHPDDRQAVAAWFDGLGSGGSREHSYRVCLPDGSVRRVRQACVPVPGPAGLPASYVGVAVDVTEADRAEAERRRLAEQFQRAQKMQALGQLAGGVAHDFNNLLSVIDGYCGLICDDRPEDEALLERVREIRGAAGEAAALTRQLLAFSRRQVLEPVVTAPNETIRKMSRMLKSVLGERVRIELRLAAGAGDISIDPAQLEQMILNLAFNSRDAMPGGGKLIIETFNAAVLEDGGGAGLPAGECVEIAVSDTGCGIPVELQEKVFEPFFTTKPKGHGTGLGLAMVYGAVKQHGGELSLHSKPGVGTTIRLHFKRVEGGKPAASAVPPPARTRGLGERILLVEDDARVRKVMMELLERSGYAVSAAGSGEDALRLFSAEGPHDLVVSDVVMPGLNGVELAARLRALAPGLPVIFCSGYAEELIGAGGAPAGDAPVLTKPVDPARLLAKIQELLAPGRAKAV